MFKKIILAVILLFGSTFAASSAADVIPTQAVRTNDLTATGTAGALNATVAITPVNSMSGLNIGVTGTWVGTLTFQVSVDGTNFYSYSVIPVSGGTSVQTTTANGAWITSVPGFASVRVIMSAYTSGTATITFRSGSGTNGITCIAGCSGSGGSTTVTYNTSAPTLTNGTTAPLQGDVNGNLKVTFGAIGATSGNPAYTTDPNNVQNAQDASHNQGVYIAGTGQGATSGSPLYSTDPNNVAINLDASKNTIVVGNSYNGTVNNNPGAPYFKLNNADGVTAKVIKANPGTMLKVMNLSTSAQTATINIYDSTSTTPAASSLIYAATLGPSQVVVLDINCTAGIVVQASSSVTTSLLFTYQ